MSLACGLFGKLPARGDFVTLGLPRSFTTPWDEWWQQGIALHRAQAPNWVEIWLTAPVWRFSLAAGICGPDAAMGLFLPSVDKAGRYFPLTLAVTGGHAGAVDIRATDAMLDAFEEAGRTALEQDTAPDALVAHLAAALPQGDAWWPATTGAALWTEGSEHVAPSRRTFSALPASEAFVRLFQDPQGG